MSQIYDLTEEAIQRLRKLIPDETVQAAADDALAKPSRKCKQSAASVHRLILTNDQRQSVLQKLRVMLARNGYENEEEGGAMLPIGHVYEGLIQMFSRPSRCAI